MLCLLFAMCVERVASCAGHTGRRPGPQYVCAGEGSVLQREKARTSVAKVVLDAVGCAVEAGRKASGRDSYERKLAIHLLPMIMRYLTIPLLEKLVSARYTLVITTKIMVPSMAYDSISMQGGRHEVCKSRSWARVQA